MLATRSTSRIVAHERPDLIEVGSTWFAPWLVHLATRRVDVPAVWFYHSNFPRVIAPWPETRRAGCGGRRPSSPGATSAGWAGWSGRRWRLRISSPASSSAAGVERVRAGRPRRRPRSLPSRAGARAPRRPAAATACPRGRWRCTSAGSPRRRRSTCSSRRGPRSSGAPAPTSCSSATAPRAAGSSAAPGSERLHWLPFQQDRDELADLLAAADLRSRPARSRPSGSRRSRPSPAAPRCSPPTGAASAETVARSGAGATFAVGRRRRARGRRSRSACCAAISPRSARPAGATPRRTTDGTRCSTASSTSIAEVLRA